MKGTENHKNLMPVLSLARFFSLCLCGGHSALNELPQGLTRAHKD